ncbi:hypothetical protein ACJMK2_033538 [Sinanodonta woodiana]|uniref:Uncharacterized protein n=1 Tax=Sinanodonta woodiana TaxID=1069815 RepID=A0ABD3WS83_SINWO
MEEVNSLSGYEAIFEPEVDRKYVCPICLAVMRDAMQTSCGHRFCKMCILGVTVGRTVSKCPLDNTLFHRESGMFEDNAVRREILSLRVICDHKDNGCDWAGELRNLEEHSSTCLFLKTTCQNGCGVSILKRDENIHMNICDRRLVQCVHCQLHVAFVDLTKHQVLICQKFPVCCTLCGQMGICREDIPRHIEKENGDCSQVLVTCQFFKLGCQFQDKRHKMPDHLRDSAHHHNVLLLKKVDTQDKHITILNKKLETVEETVKELTERIYNNESVIENFAQQLLHQNEELNTIKNTSYNGKLHWKIPISDQRVQKFQSDSFYTGCPGYKVFVSLELSGHKEGNEDYSSFFVILMKGEFDNSLRFPFNSVCRVTVHDQSDPTQPHHATINCTNVSRCQSDELSFNFCRGRLRFMKTLELLSQKFTADGYLYLDVVVDHSVTHS